MLLHGASFHALLVIRPGPAGKAAGREGRALVPFLPDVTFVIRLEIILPLVSGGHVHVYPLLVFRFGVGLIFHNQIHIFSLVYKDCSILHGEDVNESFICL